MFENFAEFDKSHFAVFSGHFNHLSSECLTEGVRGEVLNIFQHILYLYLFQDNIDALNRNDITVAVEKTFLVRVFDVQSLITLPDMLLHTSIDLYLTMLTSLLLVEGKTLTEYLFPGKPEKITDAKAEEATTSDKKAHSIFAILV